MQVKAINPAIKAYEDGSGITSALTVLVTSEITTLATCPAFGPRLYLRWVIEVGTLYSKVWVSRGASSAGRSEERLPSVS